jgi:hypothetical protein
MTIVAPVPWVDLLGLGLMIAGMALLMSSYRRRTAPLPDSGSTKQIESSSSDKAGRATITQGAPRLWRPQGLYVGQINVTTEQVASDLVSDIIISGFNATQRGVVFDRINGHVVFKEMVDDPDDKRTILPSPMLRRDSDRVEVVESDSEFLLLFEQRFARADAERFVRSYDAGGRVYLGFESLTVNVVVHGNEAENTTLRLWPAVTVSKGGERPITGRAAKSGSSATVR